MIKWTLLIISFFVFTITLFSEPRNKQDIFLSTGVSIHILNQNEILEDWKLDFENYKDALVQHNKISDYLDRKPGFSLDEKAYWILESRKTKNVIKLKKQNALSVTINKIYFLQKIILTSNKRINPLLNKKLSDNIQKLYPASLPFKDITLIRSQSAISHITERDIKKTFSNLDKKSKLILAGYIINPNDKNRKKVLNKYKQLMKDYELSIKAYYNYSSFIKKKNNKKNDYNFKDSDKIDKLQDKQSKLSKDINSKLTSTQNYLNFLYYLNDTALLSKAIDYRELFIVNLEKKYPKFKNLSQGQNKE